MAKLNFNQIKEILKESRKLLREVNEVITDDAEAQEYLYGKTPMFATEPFRLSLLTAERQRLKDSIRMAKYRMGRLTRVAKKEATSLKLVA